MIGLQPYKVNYPDGGEFLKIMSKYNHKLTIIVLDPCETLFYAVSSTSGRVVQYQVSVWNYVHRSRNAKKN